MTITKIEPAKTGSFLIALFSILGRFCILTIVYHLKQIKADLGQIRKNNVIIKPTYQKQTFCRFPKL